MLVIELNAGWMSVIGGKFQYTYRELEPTWQK